MKSITFRAKDGKEFQMDIDPEHGLMYIHLAIDELKAGATAHTESPMPGIRVDLDRDGFVLGVEADIA